MGSCSSVPVSEDDKKVSQTKTKVENTTEAKPEAAKAEEAKVDEAKPEEAKAEEAKPEEAKAEEAKPEEPKAEEAKSEEPKVEETKPEEPKAEEAKPEETKPEEAKPEEAKAEEAKQTGVPTTTAAAPSVVTKADEVVVFTEARTHKGWAEEELSVEELKEIYDVSKWGPNAYNSFPIRITFVKSAEAKEKLKPCLMEGNVPQVTAAPITAIIAYDLDFKDHFNVTSPHYDAKAVFDAMPELVEPTARRNAALLGGYFMIAARMRGYDVGPMSGFDNDAVDKAFFEGTNWKSLFMCNLGHGDASKLYPRAPRLEFEDACKFM